MVGASLTRLGHRRFGEMGEAAHHETRPTAVDIKVRTFADRADAEAKDRIRDIVGTSARDIWDIRQLVPQY